MKLNIGFCTVFISIKVSRSWLWAKGEDTYFLHLGLFSKEGRTAYKLIILPLSIMIGVVK